MTNLIPGAEPWSFDPEPVGVLCLHGFTGHPGSMRGVAEAFARGGWCVELPRLPGHGTHLEDMLPTRWEDWTAEVALAYRRLADRCGQVVVVGQSMGGALALWLAFAHPEIAGLVCVNPTTQAQPDEVLDMVRGMVDEGERIIPGGDSDIADPDAADVGYEGTPLEPLLSLMDGLAAMQDRYGELAMPLLLMTSPHDHVVDPAQSDHLAATYGGPVQRVTLARSYHVATLDYDRDLVRERAVAFAREVTG